LTSTVLHRDNQRDEATEVLNRCTALTDNEPNVTIGIIARKTFRRRVLEEEAARRNVQHEIWEMPLHDRAVAKLLKRCWREARKENTTTSQVQVLEALGREQLDPADVESLDQLVFACEHLRDQGSEGVDIDQLMGSLRTTEANTNIRPGLHLLNAHNGKGQQFDWVFVLGLEDGQIPDYRATSEDERAEELRVLHVMASRARIGLVFTHCDRLGKYRAKESPWLQIVKRAPLETW
jgi:DNA helicase-2/ATP-dependent DNA helicase PcrA